MDIQETLAQRQETHGDFKHNAAASQALKRCVEEHIGVTMTDVQIEALHNICQKIARIITANPNHADSWHDIAGYAGLIDKRLTNGTEL